MNIKKIQKLNSEIENFRSLYEGNELFGERDGQVPVEKFIEYLINHPEFQQIADSIKKIDV